MAWKTFTKTYSAGQQATVFADFCSFMGSTAGWTLHDTVSASSKVYSTTGESGTELPGYLQVSYDATYIYFRAWTWWNPVTHAGAGGCWNYASILRVAVNNASVIRFYGNKDIVYIFNPLSDALRGGHVCTNRMAGIPLVTLTGPVVAGNNVVLPLSGTEGFTLNLNNAAYIVDVTSGQRQPLRFVARDPGVSLTAQTLAHNYPAGSKVGWLPISFGIHNNGWNSFELTVGSTFTGTTDISGQGVSVSLTSLGTNSPNSPGFFELAMMRISVIAGPPTYLMGFYYDQCRTPGTAAFNSIMAVRDDKKFDILTATSGSPNTIGDETQSWGINALAGKSVVIVVGTGVDQSRIILSNTATVITVRDNWAINPIAGSNFIVADRTYVVVQANTEAVLENEE